MSWSDEKHDLEHRNIQQSTQIERMKLKIADLEHTNAYLEQELLSQDKTIADQVDDIKQLHKLGTFKNDKIKRLEKEVNEEREKNSLLEERTAILKDEVAFWKQ
eukprot:1561296-Rhodomonas_salina.1